MAEVYILLGSNADNKTEMLEKARKNLDQYTGKIRRQSSIFETEPWGFESENTFYNQVLHIETLIPPDVCLQRCLNIERKLGRVRGPEKYASRSIDLDILFYDDRVINREGLKIPHPRMHLRRFVLEPLHELIPGFLHPVLKKTVSQLLEECTDTGWVRKVKPS